MYVRLRVIAIINTMKHYQYTTIEGEPVLRAVNPYHMYTGNLNPEWRNFDKANPPIPWLGEPFEGTISEEDIEVNTEYWIYGIANNYWTNEKPDNPSHIHGKRKVATLKVKEEFKGTPGQWHSVNYGGWIHIQDEPFYGGKDLLNEDECNVAEYNGQLAASAPNLLKACQLAILEFQLLPCKCDPKVIDELELAIKKALTIEL